MRTKQRSRRTSVFLIATLAVLSISVASAQVRRPLVQDGKTALYQRVIVAPGAVLVTDPARPSEARVVPPFSSFYVYERREDGSRRWVQVGTDSNGGIDGWVDGDQVFDWNQTLTVAFRDPAKQGRVLLFGDRDSLKKIVDENDAAGYRKLRSRVADGDVAGTPVVAVQPDYNVDIRRNFYLVPILDHEDVLVGGQQSRLLRVASVPLQDSALIVETYRTGIVFVIDSTISMKPYIDATRAVMERVYRSIDSEKLGNRVSYGLVEYRDNTEAVPGLGFVTRTAADLGGTGEEFLARIRDVKPAAVSSQGFNEDTYAGVQEALRAVDWSDYYARFIVVITDAGPRDAGDPLSATGLDAGALQRLAADKDVAVGVFHMKTPASRDNHSYAEGEYRRLSTVPDVGEFYYPVQAGDVGEFESALSTLTDVLSAHVRAAAAGQPPALAGKAAAPESGLKAFQETVDRLGYGLRMRYLQERAGEGVPSLFNAWLIDRDFDTPEDRALDVRVLLTRDQLSDLHEVLRQVLITAEEGTLAPDDFLDELKSLAASVSRDPQAARTATRTVGGESLADLGYMREYLEGLPYKSEVMYLDLSIWEQWPAQRQFEFVNQLDSKVAYYRALHDNIDLWVSLDGEAVDGDSVYPLLLEALP